MSTGYHIVAAFIISWFFTSDFSTFPTCRISDFSRVAFCPLSCPPAPLFLVFQPPLHVLLFSPPFSAFSYDHWLFFSLFYLVSPVFRDFQRMNLRGCLLHCLLALPPTTLFFGFRIISHLKIDLHLFVCLGVFGVSNWFMVFVNNGEKNSRKGCATGAVGKKGEEYLYTQTYIVAFYRGRCGRVKYKVSSPPLFTFCGYFAVPRFPFFPFSNIFCPREFIDFSTDPLGVIVVIVCILKLKDAANG